MVEVLLALCIPITAAVVGYLTLKGVQLGLRWKIQAERQQEPVMEQPKFNPFEKPVREQPMDQTTLDEWLNGPRKEGE